MSAADWTVDLHRMEARHASGLVVRFRPDPDRSGAWDGEAVGTPPTGLDAASGARLMREAGDAMMAAIRDQPKS